MEPENKAAVTETDKGEGSPKAPSQEKPKYTEAEIAAYNLRRNAEKAKELGLDPAAVLELKPTIKVDPALSDDEPLTMGKLREIQKNDARLTAMQMADSITDEDERRDVKELLEKRLVPSGNAESDFALARAAISSRKNARIAEEIARGKNPPKTAPGGSSPMKVEDDFVPTPDERIFMAPPYNLSIEKIKALRNK